MIIEFFGISGVGKTTYTKKIYDQYFNEQQERVVWPRYELYVKCSWLVRNIRKSFGVVSYCIFKCAWVREVNQILESVTVERKERIKLLFNYISLRKMYYSLNLNHVNLFDEGVFQAIWALYLRCEDKPEEKLVRKILDIFPKPDKLYVITASKETIMQRLKARGLRTKILESENLSDRIEYMNTVMDEILRIATASGYIDKDNIIVIENE